MITTIRRAYADSRYGQLHYRVCRPGGAPEQPTLLCLHQTPLSGWEWEPIMPGLALDRVVIAPDTPGYGASDPPPEPVAIEDFAEVMLQLLDELQAAEGVREGPVDVIGYHTGSIIGTQLARVAPLKIRRLILIGLAAYDAPTREAKRARLGGFPIPEANDLSHVTRLWELMGLMVDPRATPAWRHSQLAEGLRPGVRLPWGFASVYGFDFIAAIEAVRQPVLIVNPQDDLHEVTKLNADRFSNGQRIDIMGAAHGLLALEPERIVQIARAFLDQEGWTKTALATSLLALRTSGGAKFD